VPWRRSSVSPVRCDLGPAAAHGRLLDHLHPLHRRRARNVLKVVTGLNIFKVLKYLGQEYLLIVGTSSSESALPQLMQKMEFAGVDKATVGIVVPTGYSFNLDGTAIYLTMSAIFIADAMHMPMNIGEQIGMLVFMILASKGAAGVSGAGLATLAVGLESHEPRCWPVWSYIQGIDKFMSEARSLTNFTGNAVATFLVGKWTKSIDIQRARDVMDSEGRVRRSGARQGRRAGPGVRRCRPAARGPGTADRGLEAVAPGLPAPFPEIVTDCPDSRPRRPESVTVPGNSCLWRAGNPQVRADRPTR
jgi:hypothetical protein